MKTNARQQDNGNGTEAELSTDDVLDLLAHSYRREIIKTVSQNNSATMQQLVTLISTFESEDPQAVEIQLHHTHIPKLEAYGVIDRDGDTIRRSLNFGVVRRWMSHIP